MSDIQLNGSVPLLFKRGDRVMVNISENRLDISYAATIIGYRNTEATFNRDNIIIRYTNWYDVRFDNGLTEYWPERVMALIKST